MSGIPGIAVGRVPAAPRPLTLLQPGALLLAGPVDLAGHQSYWGPLPRLDLPALASATGHVVGAGGAEFPTPRKLAALTPGRVGPVVINGMEGEPASAKDQVLLRRAPHLVLDGAVAAAYALGAPRIVIRVADGPLAAAMRWVARQRRDVPVDVSVGPDRFVAGEASAIARALRGGPALPDGRARPPVIGWLRRPIFLSNVETFARIAVAVRGDHRSSALVTVSGAVARPGVVELPAGATVSDMLAAARCPDRPEILVTGGWHGRWLPWSPGLADTRLTRADMRAIGGRWGAGVMVVLGRTPPPGAVLVAVADYLAAQSAGQCGPCVRGLPALAHTIRNGSDPSPIAQHVSGRGLCAHPTAASEALMSGWAAVHPHGSPTTPDTSAHAHSGSTR